MGELSKLTRLATRLHYADLPLDRQPPWWHHLAN
jgi:hypothetical protein